MNNRSLRTMLQNFETNDVQADVYSNFITRSDEVGGLLLHFLLPQFSSNILKQPVYVSKATRPPGRDREASNGRPFPRVRLQSVH